LSLKTAEYISRHLGQVSVPEERRSRAPGWFSQETVTQGYTTRPLLTPDEVRMLGKGEVIILSRDALPIRGKRLGYPDLKVLRKRAMLKPTPLRKLEPPTLQPSLPPDEEAPSSAEEADSYEAQGGRAKGGDKRGGDEKVDKKQEKRSRPSKRYVDPEET